MTTIETVRGTRDFYPEDMAFRSWLNDKIRSVSSSFGYQEYDGPILEPIDLYAAKSGAELVNEQAYVFEDRGGDVVTLRPELTPTLARMVAARIKSMPTPIRWWSFGPFWRYERPQKGRSREFFQWNIDLLGVDSPHADAEIVAVAAAFFDAIGLSPEQVTIGVNNRRLVENQLTQLGFPAEQFNVVFHVIDRREKMSSDELEAYARGQDLPAGSAASIAGLMDDQDAWLQSEELVHFFESIDAMGFRDYVAYDPSVIRGLDYYTGTVFEARDRSGEHRAILGGGRYDDLVSALGGDPVPGVGFAMGDVVVELVLREAGAFPELMLSPAKVLVATFDEQTRPQAMRFAAKLRSDGIEVEWYPEPDRIGKQFKFADRAQIPFVAVIGPDEAAKSEVTIREMATGEQAAMPQNKAAAYLRERI